METDHRPIHAEYLRRHTHFQRWTRSTGVKSCLIHDSWAASLDLQDAYLHIPIHASHRKYLRFVSNKTVFHFRSLPFGLSTAPWLFTMVMTVVKKMLHEQCVKIFMYLDDWLIVAATPQLCTAHVAIVRALCQQLGLGHKREEIGTSTITGHSSSWGFTLSSAPSCVTRRRRGSRRFENCA